MPDPDQALLDVTFDHRLHCFPLIQQSFRTGSIIELNRVLGQIWVNYYGFTIFKVNTVGLRKQYRPRSDARDYF